MQRPTKTIVLLILFSTILLYCREQKQPNHQKSSKTEGEILKIKKTNSPIIIDGFAEEAVWQNADWHPIDKIWLGDSISKADFQGKYKLSWSEEALYLLAEIQDDTLVDLNKNPLKFWWDDDCLEIFIDEDNSGGEHQYNHNAFAYHVALDGNVVDMSTTKEGKLYNSHIKSKRATTDNTSLWEVKISLYDDTYSDRQTNQPIKLNVSKKIGFAIAYCDNDYSNERENFIGSISVAGEDKNKGWIDANIFGTILLVD